MKTKLFFRSLLSSGLVRLMHFVSQAHKMKVSLTFAFCLLPFAFSYSQVPLGFNYQAVVRDAQGDIISDQDVSLRISILQGSETGTPVYVETHQETTNSFGLITLEIGSGTMISGNLPAIDWSADTYFLKIELDVDGGSNYQYMGTSKLLSVPYALNAGSVTSLKSLNIMEQPGNDVDSALFEVKNQDGNTVFAVYNEGVRVYVNDDPTKGLKGGFAVGGFNSSKGATNEYLRVTPDSVRVYIDETIAKGLKGGFAVGGFSPGKAGSANMMHLTPDNYFIGHQSGSSITTGLYNSFFGYQSGLLNDIGNRNVFLGYKTGYSNTEGNYNTFIGSNTGYSNTEGLSNVFVGDSSGYDNTIGSYNVFMGNLAGVQNDSGYYNVFIGDSAGYSNVEGNQNIFLGVGAGFSNKSGGHNVFLGVESGRNNTEGTANVILGDYAGHLLDTGDYNIFIGASSGYSNIGGKSNVFLGTAAGYDNDTGNYNIMIGNWSGAKNTSGKSNVFMGYAAGYSNTTADWNICIGNLAGYSNEDGEKNVFLGAEAGKLNTSGYKNVFLGNLSGYDNTTGYRNVFVGSSSGENSTDAMYNAFLGTSTGYSNTTGTRNTFIGNEAGYSNTTGGYNVYVGRIAGYTNSTSDSCVFIGNAAGYFATGSNLLYIDNSSTSSPLIYGNFDSDFITINGTLNVNDNNFHLSDNVGSGLSPAFYIYQGMAGSTASSKEYAVGIYDPLWVYGNVWADSYLINSDKRFKKNIRIIDNSLVKVIGLKGVYFEWEQSFIKGNDEEPTNKKYEHKQEVGFVAQDVEKFLPEVVHTDAAGYKSVDYSKISALLVEAIKEQQKMIKELQERIAVLEGKNE
ncbi:MAG: tail fiber domain-containing protein [Bacteroidales bacterium]|nr:tail fiber domain-containing protein [Bacteroidales bacterium]